jgi:CheY-like chemotaxis protein
MFMRKHYDVLVVDDEPDVLAVTKLALKNVQYNGIPLRLHLFGSAEAARRHLGGRTFLPATALAIVDVVMETEEAGLALCDFIRHKQGNQLTQIVIRTGQAASFPEIEVVERYDISGFVSKADASDLRLTSTAKTSIRQYDWACTAALFYQLYNTLILGFRSPAELCEVLDSFIRKTFIEDEALRGAIEPHLRIVVGEHSVVTGIMSDPFHVETAEANLSRAPEKILNVRGDSYRQAPNDRGSLDVKLALGRDTDKMPPVHVLARLHGAPPAYAVQMWLKLLYALRRLSLVSSYVEDLLLDSRLDRVWSWDLEDSDI